MRSPVRPGPVRPVRHPCTQITAFQRPWRKDTYRGLHMSRAGRAPSFSPLALPMSALSRPHPDGRRL
jgi:hypothetical protein